MTCNGPHSYNCVTCNTSDLSKKFLVSISSGKTCDSKCPEKTYANPTFECIKCHASCATCDVIKFNLFIDVLYDIIIRAIEYLDFFVNIEIGM